jgi:membrane-associated phospholipid phosphatase
MNSSFDQRVSRQLFEATKKHWVLRHVATFAAGDLIWFMIGLFCGLLVWEQSLVSNEYFWPIISSLGALCGAYLVTFYISRLVKRSRPYQEESFVPILKPFIETYSFPSAHATFAFALAGLVYEFPELFGYFFIGAVIVSIARVAVGIHYVSDVLAGAVIGLLFGKATQIAILLLLLFLK